MKITAPKGTRDILPDEVARWQWVERTFAETCALYGYQEIRVPTFEHTELFQRGVGDTTDVVQKEMYTFEDKAGRSLSLRPEGTAGVVRAYVENGLASQPSPLRVYYNITAFRYENVQKGRYREFHQFGAEAFGAAGPAVDAEQIHLLDQYFKKLGLAKTSLHINSIGCPVCRTAYHDILRDYLRPHLGTLCETCNVRFDKNPLRVIDCKVDRCKAITQEAPALLDHLCPDCQNHFDSLRRHLDLLGIEPVIDRGIVRGLDYYTRTVFEFVSKHVGTQGTICGGGRYDGLVESIGGHPTPGIGFALGVERLLMELAAQGVEPSDGGGIRLYIASMEPTRDEAAVLCARIRDMGIAAETDLIGRSLKAQMKYAAKKARHVLVLGEDEAASGQARLRDLSQGTEVDIDLNDLASIRRHFSDGR